MNTKNNNNNLIDREKVYIQNEFVGEIVNIIDDVIEVKDEYVPNFTFALFHKCLKA